MGVKASSAGSRQYRADGGHGMKIFAALCAAASLLSAIPAFADDAAIKDKIVSAVDSDPDADLKGIKVDVRNGVAYFTGHVGNHRQIDNVLAQTLMVNGVRNIESSVTVSGGIGNVEGARASYNPACKADGK